MYKKYYRTGRYFIMLPPGKEKNGLSSILGEKHAVERGICFLAPYKKQGPESIRVKNKGTVSRTAYILTWKPRPRFYRLRFEEKMMVDLFSGSEYAGCMISNVT